MLGSLTNLEALWLSSNQLTGEIPAELGSLTNLEALYLFSNQLTGEIPAELGSLTNLEALYLFSNQLTGTIPAELGNLANLRFLSLNGNQLSGEIPSELGSLANLQWLHLDGNQLSEEIPAELGSLTDLEELFLSGNQLTGCIPVGIAGVANNDFNQLGLPFCAGASGAPTIGTLTPGADFLTITWAAPTGSTESAIIAYDLRYIESAARDKSDVNWTVVDNAWTAGSGALSYQITGLTGGAQYDVQMRAVSAAGDGPWSAAATGTPTRATTRPCTTGVAVSGAASNPGRVADCEALLAARDTLAGSGTLNWSGNSAIGSWDGVTLSGSPLRVTKLVLRGRQLTGTIPPELGGLASLVELNLGGNRLTGLIPSELSSLTNLEELYLWGNQLTGPIPAELGGLANLERLWLNGNQLTGEIPSELGSLTNLDGLSLNDNQLTGEIPAGVGDLTSLKWLYLDNNQLTGEIPAELGSLAGLEELFLGGNGLTGCIPGGLRDVPLNDLAQLGLDYCMSAASAGDAATDRDALVALYNATSGDNWANNDNWLSNAPIGEWHGVTTDSDDRVTHLNLHHNQLTGEIPAELGSLTSLGWLHLNNNQLTGEIPAELGRSAQPGTTVARRQPVDRGDTVGVGA